MCVIFHKFTITECKSELIHIYNIQVYLHIAGTPFGVNVHTSVSIQNDFNVCKIESCCGQPTAMMETKGQIVSHQTHGGIRSKCYISLIWDFKEQAPVSLDMVWHNLSSLSSDVIYKHDHWVTHCTLTRSTKLPAVSLYLKNDCMN